MEDNLRITGGIDKNLTPGGTQTINVPPPSRWRCAKGHEWDEPFAAPEIIFLVGDKQEVRVRVCWLCLAEMLKGLFPVPPKRVEKGEGK